MKLLDGLINRWRNLSFWSITLAANKDEKDRIRGTHRREYSVDEEASTAGQGGGAGSLDQSGNSVGGEKWRDLKCPLKVESVGFADTVHWMWDMRHKEESKLAPRFSFERLNEKYYLPLTDMEDTGERAGWQREQTFCSGHIKFKLRNSIQLGMSSR